MQDTKLVIDFDLRPSDIVIRRAQNGFVVYTSSLMEGSFDIHAYEEDDSSNSGPATALMRLVYDHFYEYCKSKHSGGLVMSVEDQDPY